MEEAVSADRVIVLDHGKIALDGTPREIFAQVDKMKSFGLTVPATVELMAKLKEKGLNTDLTALTTDEAVDCITRILEDNIG